jgi:predicted Zn-dependent peptidase
VTLDDVLNGMQDIATDEELRRAKEIVARQLPTFEATGRITARLLALETQVVYGLPDDYHSTYGQAVEAVGAADVRRVARQYLRPEGLAFVVVGDMTTIAEAVRGLNLGPATTMTIDEVFAAPR